MSAGYIFTKHNNTRRVRWMRFARRVSLVNKDNKKLFYLQTGYEWKRFRILELDKGLPPLQPRLPFYLDAKRKQKRQGYARFAQKTGARQAKLSKLAPSFRLELQTMDNFTLASLVF